LRTSATTCSANPPTSPSPSRLLRASLHPPLPSPSAESSTPTIPYPAPWFVSLAGASSLGIYAGLQSASPRAAFDSLHQRPRTTAGNSTTPILVRCLACPWNSTSVTAGRPATGSGITMMPLVLERLIGRLGRWPPREKLAAFAHPTPLLPFSTFPRQPCLAPAPAATIVNLARVKLIRVADLEVDTALQRFPPQLRRRPDATPMVPVRTLLLPPSPATCPTPPFT